MPQPTRFYLRNPEGTSRPLLWFLNNRPNEMLLGVYGLRKKQAVLVSQFPETAVAPGRPLTIKYSEALPVGEAVDHITCHADGTFHVKTIHGKDLYIHTMRRVQPLHRDTPIFLDFVVLTDVLSKYRAAAVKSPSATMFTDEKQMIELKGQFSGADFQLEEAVLQRLANKNPNGMGSFPGILVSSGTLKGVLLVKAWPATPDLIAKRPAGTFIQIRFPLQNGGVLCKTFLFE